MGGGELPKIPDWRIYTIGEHCPELQHTQRMLKSVGLSVNNIFSIIQSRTIYVSKVPIRSR